MTSRKGKFNGASGNLMALGSAAVLAVYAAGYLRTKPAADQLAAQSSMRSMRRPFPPTAGAQGAPERPAASPSLDAALRTLAGDSAAAAAIAAAKAAAASALPAATATIAAIPGTGSPTAPTDPASITPTAPAVVRDSVAVIAASASAPAVPTPVPTPAPAPAPVVIPPSPAPASVAPAAVASLPAAPSPTPVAVPAPAAAPATPTAKPAARAGYRDGLHYGRGTSRHGDIESLIEISNGRIISVVISQCLTQYTCRWISALPGQVIARQSPDVDYVTGATESANAFYFSIVQALMQAK